MDKDLWDASSDGKLENVKKELARGADVNWTATEYFDHKSTSLIIAVIRGHDTVVQHLLQQPEINVNTADANGMTALHWACLNKCSVEMLRMLLAARGQACYNLRRNWSGVTPLMCAINHNKLDHVKELLGVEEVDLDTRDKKERGLEDTARLERK